MEKFHHGALVVSDIKKALSWYQSEFDMAVKYADLSSTRLQLENKSLPLDMAGRHSLHKAVKRERAKSYGRVKRLRNATESASIEDPSGNTVEIMGTKLEGSQQ